jgi:hypothetical protein
MGLFKSAKYIAVVVAPFGVSFALIEFLAVVDGVNAIE